jgi:hypothetical protein
MLSERIQNYINAGFSGNWILTYEPEEVQREMTRLAFSKEYEISVWDIAKGLYNPMRPSDAVDPKTRNPLSAFLSFAKPQGTAPRIVLLWNYHFFFKEREVVQAFYNAVLEGQQNQVYYFILSCHAEIPKEIEKLIVLHTHPLPSDDEIVDIANNLLERPDKTPVEKPVIHAARGLTRREAEGAFSISISTKGTIDPVVVNDYKKESVGKSGFLSFYEGPASFENLCGLEQLKWFSKKLLNPENTIQPKGILLLGPPGTGKSQFAKALGKEVNRTVLMCDLGKIYAKHVGETEGNLRELIDIAESVAPCILFIDELEKALSGSTSEGDSGVSRRVFGKLLTWLADKTSDVFVIGTANNVQMLPPEFSRSGRFDGLFFIDIPNAEERKGLWEHYLSKYKIQPSQKTVIEDEGWTGAEIEECCKKSFQLGIGLDEASRYIIPVSTSRHEEILKLQEWSKSRCMSSSHPGRYFGNVKPTTPKPSGQRRALLGET